MSEIKENIKLTISSKTYRQLQKGIDELTWLQEHTKYNGMEMTPAEFANYCDKMTGATDAIRVFGEKVLEHASMTK